MQIISALTGHEKPSISTISFKSKNINQGKKTKDGEHAIN
jgi:hypothetical protein